MMFIGATTSVTGSMTLLENKSGKILIDCGLYQGMKDIVQYNLHELPFNPKELKAIILTHAHLDHCGFIPRLTKLGFRGNIYCTKPTMKLALLIMDDSVRIAENTEGHILNSFFDVEDVVVASSLFKTKNYEESFDVLGMKVKLLPAGHILGASSVEIQADKKIVFSGDLGRSDDPIIFSPPPCPKTDVLVLESTYGGKRRNDEINDELVKFIKKVRNESKVGIIASFAVSRAQLLITLLHDYFEVNPDQKVRVAIDGPMMVKANRIYSQFTEETKSSDHLKSALEEIEVIDNIHEWESIKKRNGPLILISSSGMVSGGRILGYLEHWQNDENAILFLPGYQAYGTAGKALSEGVRDIRYEGRPIHWSGEVMTTDAFSSHADQDELIEWIKNIDKNTSIFLNHGEYNSKVLLQKKLNELGYSNVQIAIAEEEYL